MIRDLAAIFPRNSLADLKNIKHYYHAPAMGKCFPDHDRVEYMSGAVAGKGNDFALIANTRIQVDQQTQRRIFFSYLRRAGRSVQGCDQDRRQLSRICCGWETGFPEGDDGQMRPLWHPEWLPI
jgi:hypothetical protein